MRRSCPSTLLAASLALFSVTQAAAGSLCKPVLALRDVRIPEPQEMQRTWTGVLVADASRCSATTSGLFDIQFTRLKELSPDLQFTERFTWVSGQSGPVARLLVGRMGGGFPDRQHRALPMPRLARALAASVGE